MTLVNQLRTSGIEKALIVDDVFDRVPTASDLRDGPWSTFFDDLTDEDDRLLRELYPQFADDAHDPEAQDEFVKLVWLERERLQKDNWEQLFRSYLEIQAGDQEYVDALKSQLETWGLTVEQRGRDFETAVSDADLVVIDLYLGASQDEESFERSQSLLRNAVTARHERPPLVLLMSRSGRLESKKDDFRDSVGLVDSGFRIIEKSDIESTRLETQLERLAVNSEDTLKLSRFLFELDSGIRDAADEAIRLMRKIRLSDIGQVQQLLLDAEGQPVGSYLVDVFDRVLQYELERQTGIIDAAVAMNDFATAEHPPPYVAGSTDLQQIVARTLAQHVKRLELPGSKSSQVAFGDLLIPSKSADQIDAGGVLGDIVDQDVLLVVTPACDLQRDDVPRILLLAGEIVSLDRSTWKYTSGARTAAVRINGELVGVTWSVKHLESISRRRLDEALGSGALSIVARLREAHVLELQQKVLADLGRVGQMSNLPATFAVELEAYYVQASDSAALLPAASLGDGAVCFVGRDDRGNSRMRLVLTENQCDDLQAAVDDLTADDVSRHVRRSLETLKGGSLRRAIFAGIELGNAIDLKFRSVGSVADNVGKAVPLGVVAWNQAIPDDGSAFGDHKGCCLVLVVRNLESDRAVSSREAAGLAVPDDEISN
ncbi:hypothetical protein [Nocardioides zeae]|uniref:Response receiver domain-containing protein n=1 Tax=Nocardioides zeae TaxID=1457234 RepID=A0AAJ1U249_9ACTN|nr:hypothetical protein [Nocardioides zeae]MDQ1102872.1 hypothetical protein [Nocardioides zeae]